MQALRQEDGPPPPARRDQHPRPGDAGIIRTRFLCRDPAAGRQYPAMDGTGVPMRREETKGIRGRQEDGSPKTGGITKDRGSGTVGDAGEVVMPPDGAAPIVDVCREMLPGPGVTHVPDPRHAPDHAGDALEVPAMDRGGRKRRIGDIGDEPKAGRVHGVIARPEPFRDRGRDVAACIDHCRNNRDRCTRAGMSGEACRSAPAWSKAREGSLPASASSSRGATGPGPVPVTSWSSGHACTTTGGPTARTGTRTGSRRRGGKSGLRPSSPKGVAQFG